MSFNHARELLQAYGASVTDELGRLFAAPPSQLFGVELSDASNDAFEKLREYSLRPSKRVRGALTAFAYDQAAGTRLGASGVRAGVAIELAQSYLLIIDDVMDRSETRRGRPSVHELYRKEHNDEHAANMLAINVGMLASHALNLMLSSVDENPKRVVQAMRVMHRYLGITGFGQLDDTYQRIGREVDEQAIIRKYTFKSSYYTFVNPAQIGAILGGVSDEKQLEEMEAFGVPAGIAFQLHDDVLGVFGDTAATGKSALDDLKEGKYTLLLHHALEHAGKADVQTLKQAVGNPALTMRDMQRIQGILEQCGSKAFVGDRAAWYARQAKAALKVSTFWSDQAKAILASLIDYSITRDK
jgi:geranylgeranyl diphosphate synthase type I